MRPQPADCVWTKRECRKRPWGKLGTTRTKLRLNAISSPASCPQLASTHSPFAHTPPRESAADCGRLRRNSNKFLTERRERPTLSTHTIRKRADFFLVVLNSRRTVTLFPILFRLPVSIDPAPWRHVSHLTSTVCMVDAPFWKRARR